MQTASKSPAVVFRPGLGEFTDKSDPTLNRWMRDGKFPAPIGDINGRRFWDRSQLVEWANGKTFGWSGHDAGFAERQAAARKRTEALRRWHEAGRPRRAEAVAAA